MDKSSDKGSKFLANFMTRLDAAYHSFTCANEQFQRNLSISHFIMFNLCIPLSLEYIECTEMVITEFLLFILTATLGGMFLCGANDLKTIFVAPE